MLNSLYGKFGLNPNVRSKYPCLEDDKIRYIMHDPEVRDPIYIPVATFVTSYARNKTIRTSQSIMDYSIKKYGFNKYIYSDTDSIKTTLTAEELEEFCEIDDVKLGAWKNEGCYDRAKFIRQKCYIAEENGEIHITCAGMPKNCYDFVIWENFKTGFSCGGKLTFKHVEGGVKLVETESTIKEDKTIKNIEKF